MSDDIPLTKSALEALDISDVRNIFKREFPGEPVGGRKGITKDHLIGKLLKKQSEVGISTGDTDEEISKPSSPNREENSSKNIKEYYREELGKDLYDKINDTLVKMPTWRKISKLWGEVILEPWQEYNREMLLIEGDIDGSILTKGKSEEAPYISDKQIMSDIQSDNVIFYATMTRFAGNYIVVTWVLAYVGNHLATTALVSVVDEWELLPLTIKDNLTLSAIVYAKSPEIADKVYAYIVDNILPNYDMKIHESHHSKKAYFDLRLLQVSADTGHANGIKIANKNISPSASTINIYREMISLNLMKNDYLEAFKELYPYMTNSPLIGYIRYATSDIIRYIHYKNPKLINSSTIAKTSDGSEQWWDNSLIEMLKHPKTFLDRLKSIMLWETPKYLLSIALLFSIRELTRSPELDNIMEYLIRQGADPANILKLVVPFGIGDDKLLKLFIEKGLSLSSDGKDLVWLYAEKGYITGLKILLDTYNVPLPITDIHLLIPGRITDKATIYYLKSKLRLEEEELLQ